MVSPSEPPVLTLAPQVPRERSALVESVVDTLREAIIQQRLKPGERLNQVQIAEQLGVSRMPVREAITVLTSEGLVEPLRAGGVAVRPLRARDVQDVYAVRIALESYAARSLAEGTSRFPTRVDDVLDAHRLSIPSYTTKQLLEVDSLFHRSILESTGNDYFLRSLVPVWSVVERAMYAVLQAPEIVSTVWEEHESIAAAIREGDADKAEVRLRNHLTHGAKVFQERIPVESTER